MPAWWGAPLSNRQQQRETTVNTDSPPSGSRIDTAIRRHLILLEGFAGLARFTDPGALLEGAERVLQEAFPSSRCTALPVKQGKLDRWQGASPSLLESPLPRIVTNAATTGAPLRDKTGAEMAIPLTVEGTILGVLHLKSTSTSAYSADDERVVSTAALSLAALLDSAHRRLREARAIRDTISTLSAMVEGKDDYTEGHCQRIAEMALAMGIRFRLSATRMDVLTYASLLHDIGKIAVPDRILNKPGRLTDLEFEIMKTHTTVGRRILEGIEQLRDVSLVVEQHHERYDGGGYPNGLAGENILLEARIIAVVDAFDAMTSTRPYRSALPRPESIRRLREGAGGQFDPGVIDAFVRYFIAR